MTAVIDAHKRRNITVLDIWEVFLTVTNNEHIIILLEGKMVELLTALKPELY